MGYIGFLSLGLGAALNVLILKARSRQDSTQTAALARTGIRLQFKQTMIYLPVIIALAWVMPLLVSVQDNLRNELRISALISIVIVSFISPLGIFRTILECSQSGYYVNAALLVQSVFITCLSVLFGWLGYGMFGQATAAVIGYFVYHALLTYFAKKWLAQMRTVTAATIERAELWRLRLPLALAGVGNQVNLMTDFIVIGFILGPASVTTFVITQRVISFVGGFAVSMGSVSWAGLAELRASGDTENFELRMLELVRLLVAVGVTIVGTVAAYNAAFVNLWVGGEYYGGDALSICFALQTVVFGFVCLFAWTIDMQGDTKHRVVVSTIGSILNVGLSFILGRRFGLSGITLATVISYLVTDAWFCPYLFCRRYNVRVTAVAATVLRGLMLGLPWAAGVWFVAHRQRGVSSWVGFSTELGVFSVLGLTYSWTVILNSNERNAWRKRLQNLLVLP